MTENRWEKSAGSGLMILFLAAVAYLPALQGTFIWDDDDHVFENPCIVGPFGLKEIWTTSAARICPLTQTTFWIQYHLWGLNPMPYHAVNIVIHGLCGMLLWQVLLSLGIRGAWLGGALWALHPVQVESVAWITELKNTQSGLFFLLCVLAYIKSRKSNDAGGEWGNARFYAVSLLCGAMAMASKSSTVILPLVLGLCDWWMEGRWRARGLQRLLPFFILSGMTAALSIWTQRLEGAAGVEFDRSFAERVIVSGKVIWFYLWKLIWPEPLIFIYPRWQVQTDQMGAYVPWVGAVLMLFILWRNRNRWGRSGFFALTFYLVALLPVLGLVNHYFLRYSFVGDHFQYLASMGPLSLAAALVVRFVERLERRCGQLAMALPVCLVAVCMTLTWRHATVFRSNETLWRDTLTKNPNSWLAHNNLGTVLLARGDSAGAIERFQRTLELHPRYTEGHANLANALMEIGETEKAIEHYRLALEFTPDHPAVHNSLGVALAMTGKTDEAVGHFQEALKGKRADIIMAHDNLGSVLAMTGREQAALSHFEEVLRLDPRRLKTRVNYARTLAALREYDRAVNQYLEALRSSPNDPAIQMWLGIVLSETGRSTEAAFYLREALKFSPNLQQARERLQMLEGQ